MADLSDNSLKQIRDVIREEVSDIRTDVGTLKTDVGTLKSDVGTLKSDVGTLKSDVGSLKTNVATLNTDVGVLKTDVGTLNDTVRKQGVLMEDLDSQFKTVAELISDNLKVKGQVDNHEARIAKVEGSKKLISSTVALHSRQIKALQN